MTEDLSTFFRNKQTNKQDETTTKKRKQKEKPALVEKSLNSTRFGLNGDSFYCNFIGWPNSQVQNLIS